MLAVAAVETSCLNAWDFIESKFEKGKKIVGLVKTPGCRHEIKKVTVS